MTVSLAESLRDLPLGTLTYVYRPNKCVLRCRLVLALLRPPAAMMALSSRSVSRDLLAADLVSMGSDPLFASDGYGRLLAFNNMCDDCAEHRSLWASKSCQPGRLPNGICCVVAAVLRRPECGRKDCAGQWAGPAIIDR